MQAAMTSEIMHVAENCLVISEVDRSQSNTGCTLAALDRDCLTKVLDCFPLQTRYYQLHCLIGKQKHILLFVYAGKYTA